MRIKSSRKAPAEKTVVKRSAKSAARKVSVRKPAGTPVVFTIHGERGRAVYLAGEFNNWDPTARKMAYKARSGIYTATVKLAPGSVLKLGSPVYVDVATDPRVTPVRGTAIKVLDWSEATFDAGRAPTAADFTARPESNSDIRKLYLFVRDDCLYVSYVSVRYPPATLMMLR